MTESSSLLEFPCSFPIEVMGKNLDDFESVVKGIIFRHAQSYPGEEIKARASGAGNFLSVTITIEALSQKQLDDIYQDLTHCEEVLMAL